LCELLSKSVLAQPLQREWVRNYFNVQTKTNQATAIAIAPDGNIVVAGTSQNEEGDRDYDVIKYRPNGDEAWRARYGSPSQGDDHLRSMTLDPNGNIIVTGTSATVKFNASGAFVWAVPLAGRALIANDSYVYVTGFSDVDIATAQLENNNVDGKELWRRSVDGKAHGPDIGQAIAMDATGNIFIAGQLDDRGCSGGSCYFGPGVVSYTPEGVERWVGRRDGTWPTANVLATCVLIHPDGSVYVCGTYEQGITAFFEKFGQDGSYQGNYLLFANVGTKAIIDRVDSEIMVTGRKTTEGTSFPQAGVVMKFTGQSASTPEEIWRYQSPSGGWTEGSDIGQDSVANVYVAGFSGNDPDSYSNAMLLVKMTSSGQHLGLDRYNDSGSVNTLGKSLAIDKNDNVYVTGYAENAQGGSKFVTIKYTAAPKIEKQPSGVMHIEFHTSASGQYAIEGTSDFFNWQSLITNTADANGLIQFDDTNAPTIPYRFYRGKQP
jgi:hypothetical protein